MHSRPNERENYSEIERGAVGRGEEEEEEEEEKKKREKKKKKEERKPKGILAMRLVR
jgi:hypothetical protein